MKRSVRVLSFIVSILAVFSFMNIALAQKKVKAPKVTKPAVTQPAVEQPTVTQPAAEQPTTPQPEVVTPDVDVRTASVAKKDSTFALGVDFGYDFLAKYKELEVDEDYDGSEKDGSISSSDNSAKYLNLNLSVKINSGVFRLGFGLGFILPREHTSTAELYVLDEEVDHAVESAAKVTQELDYGIALQLIQFGYKIKLGSKVLVPYVGLDLLYLKATNSYEWFICNREIKDETGSTELHKLLIPLYTGLDFIFANAGPVSFYTGLELGYAVKVVYKYDREGWGYGGGKVADSIKDESDPFTGLTGKVKIGTAFNF